MTALCASLVAAAPAPDQQACPAGGTVRFGVEPFEAAARILPAYNALAKMIGDRVGCPVELSIPSSYNAEIEAMRSGKLDAGEFGPLGYVLAHRVANADVIATFGNAQGAPVSYYASIVTWRGSGIATIKDLTHHTFAFSDPASTSGHLLPAYGLRTNGIDPDRDVHVFFAGSHTATYEALRHHKVDAGELNSNEITSAMRAGEYAAADWVTLWRSAPIPNDAIALRRDLSPAFKARLVAAIRGVRFADLPTAQRALFPAEGTTGFVPMRDAAYDGIRKLVTTLHIDLNTLS